MKPTGLSIHHSVTPYDLDILKSINSFNNSHKTRFQNQGMKISKLGNWCAYQAVSGWSDKHKKYIIITTREDSEQGWTDSNWDANSHGGSIYNLSICMCGNFDTTNPPKGLLKVTSEWIIKKKLEYSMEISMIQGHRIWYIIQELMNKQRTPITTYLKLLKSENLKNLYRQHEPSWFKTCPGKNISDALIKSLADPAYINMRLKNLSLVWEKLEAFRAGDLKHFDEWEQSKKDSFIRPDQHRLKHNADELRRRRSNEKYEM